MFQFGIQKHLCTLQQSALWRSSGENSCCLHLILLHCVYSDEGCKAFFNKSELDRKFCEILIIMINTKSVFTQRKFAYNVQMRFLIKI